MKILATALSFFILSLTLAPAVQVLHTAFSRCKVACCKKPIPEKEDEGCDKKSCMASSCCIKSPGWPLAPYKHSSIFLAELKIQHNFKPKNDYISLRSFDIWHPPRFA